MIYKEINNNFIIASRAYFLQGTARTPADRGRLGDAGSEGGPALGAGPTSVRHGHDGRRRTRWWKTNSGTPLPGTPNVGFRVPADP